MDQPETPRDLPPISAAELQLQAWQELRERMQSLHAELEYIRLMLKLQKR